GGAQGIPISVRTRRIRLVAYAVGLAARRIGIDDQRRESFRGETFDPGFLHRALYLLVEAGAEPQVNDGGERTGALRLEERASNSLGVRIVHRDGDDIRVSPTHPRRPLGQPRLGQPFHDAPILAFPLRMRGKESFGARLRVLGRLFIVDLVTTHEVARSGEGESARYARIDHDFEIGSAFYVRAKARRAPVVLFTLHHEGRNGKIGAVAAVGPIADDAGERHWTIGGAARVGREEGGVGAKAVAEQENPLWVDIRQLREDV